MPHLDQHWETGDETVMATTAQRIILGPYFSGGELVTSPRIYHYTAGTSDDKDAWSDRAKMATIAQPFVGDSSGISTFFADGLYKFVIKTSADATLYTLDDYAVTQPLSLADESVGFSAPLPTVRNLTGSRHSTPTRYTLGIPNYVALSRQSSGQESDVVVRRYPVSVTIDATLSGPIAGGRDQSAAFPNPSWVNLYYIWNGITFSGVASLNTNASGPTLPTGYTHWAYATTLYYTTEFQDAYVMGSRVYHDISAFTGLTSVSMASIGSLSAIVPPLATHAFGWARMSGTSTAGGSLDMTLTIAARSASPVLDAASIRAFQSGINSVSQVTGDGEFTVSLLTAQTVYYQISNTSGTSPSGTVRIKGYVVPNGDY